MNSKSSNKKKYREKAYPKEKKIYKKILHKLKLFILKKSKKENFAWKISILGYKGYETFNIFRAKWVTPIKEINLEFVNYCNLRCKWCSLDHSKEKKTMSKKLLNKLLLNLIIDKRFKNVKILHLHNAGETLLHKDLIGMLNIIAEYKNLSLKLGITFPAVTLLTNGMPLNKKLSKKIIKSNALDLMRFSVDGGSKEELEKIRRGVKWDILYKNISNFQKINNKKIETEIICIIKDNKPLNINWMTNEFISLLNMVDTYSLRYPHDWDGTVKFDISERTKKRLKNHVGCYFLNHSLVLLPNGDLTVCCMDLNSRGIIGNLNKTDLYSIYNSKERKKKVKLMLNNKKEQIELCKNCPGS